MLNYFSFDYKKPILSQLPPPFKSAAIILHPFVQMPKGWENAKRENSNQMIYPDDDEILKLGVPVKWKTLMNQCKINNYKEMILALKTLINSLREEYSREDIMVMLQSVLKDDLFIPDEDRISAFLMSDILKVLGSKGATTLWFSDYIGCKDGWLNINETKPLDICEITGSELLLVDENKDFGFINFYESFFTLFMTREMSIEKDLQSISWEFIPCGENTYLDWFLRN
jgi:hypothetical protein